jgi:SRSO17 transposase
MTKPREPGHTVAFVDDYCAHYRSVFHNVRHFEQFTQVELGLLAETKRKSLPRLAKTAQAEHQALHHFLANAEWSVDALRAIRLRLTRDALAGRPLLLCIDETGDRKKGHTTDYAASQYIGNLHGLANGVVSVNAYGVLDTVTFPLAFRIYKPKTRLKGGDIYKSKPQLAVELIQELQAQGFRFSVVLADSLYGESGPFISALHRLGLQSVVALRPNHGVWMLPGQRLRQTRRSPFRPRLHRRHQRAAVRPRDELWHPQLSALLPTHHRSRDTAARDHLGPGPHDQPAWEDRADGRQYVRVAHVDRIRLQTRQG